jgi:hypothetical protein
MRPGQTGMGRLVRIKTVFQLRVFLRTCTQVKTEMDFNISFYTIT